MATQSFDAGNRRYIPSHIVTYNSARGRFWTAHIKQDNAWLVNGTRFHPLRATREQISKEI